MVDENGDIPERAEVKPDSASGTPIKLLKELLDRGETQVYLTGSNPAVDPPDYELHGYDTYVFSNRNIIYTQNQDEDEVWFYADQIASIEQH